jgi:hypothetical protein
MDSEFVEAFVSAGFPVIRVSSKPDNRASTYSFKGLQVVLKQLGVFGNKHAPHEYLWASESQRRALLAGLLDTDGNVSGSSVEFVNTRRELTEAVAQLARSLGHKVNVREGTARLYGRDCGPKWSVKFTANSILFRLPRKTNAQQIGTRRTTQFRYIVSAERVAPVPMKCIAVSSPDNLYLAGEHFIPTHNTQLLLGLALTAHQRSIIFRRNYTQFKGGEGLIQQALTLTAGRGHFSSRINGLMLKDGRTVEFGGVEDMGELGKWKGRAHDLKGFDELPEFLESMYLFLVGWLRTTDPNQRTRIVGAGNPPTTADGEWVLRRWGAWLDGQHDHPAMPGELRWYARIDDKDKEVESGEPFQYKDETVTPRSRTFIPASLKDNPMLARTGYANVLAGLEEPLRSQLLYGDFSIGIKDDAWQVIPTRWVDEAMRRWHPENRPEGPADAIGFDVARGGDAKNVLSQRWGAWFAPLHRVPGKDTPDSGEGARIVSEALQHGGVANIDVGGPGAAVVDTTRMIVPYEKVMAVNFGAGTKRRDRSGLLKFMNIRAFMYWSLREALDPEHGDNLALPPDPELKADLCAARYEIRISGIKVEDKEELMKRLHRSPDAADAVVLCAMPSGAPVAFY